MNQRVRWVWLFAFFFGVSSFAVNFTQREYKFTVSLRAPISVDLATLTKNVAPGANLRFVAHNPPTWLTIQQNGKMSGMALTQGTFRFGLHVFEGKETDLTFIEYSVYTTPEWVGASLDLGTQWEGRSWSLDLASLLKSKQKGASTFEAAKLPAWMRLDGQFLRGTPSKNDLGAYRGVELKVRGPVGSPSQALAAGKVAAVPVHPTWKKQTFVLSDATEDGAYEQDLSSFVINPGKVVLNFKFIPNQHPVWTNLTNSGGLFGKPRRKDIGPQSVEVSFEANVAGEAVLEKAKFTFQVVRVNQAPTWAQENVVLPKGVQDTPYQADLSGFVDDPDLALGDGLSLDIVSGPAWAKIIPPATLKGQPPAGFVGVQNWRIKVRDVAGLSATATVTTEILKANKPPTFQSGVEFNLKSREIAKEDLQKFATDPEGQKVTFEGVELPSWVSLSAEGKLELSPKFPNVGEHTLKLKVGDGNSQKEGSFKVTVADNPHIAIWLEDPVTIKATSGVAFAISVAEKAKDLDGQKLEFTKKSGPDWLIVDANGRVGGTPKSTEVGDIKAVVLAKNRAGEAPADILIKISQGNRPPKWSNDPLSLGVVPPGKEFTFNLSNEATDLDGDRLTFTVIQGPEWLKLTLDGKLSGTPFAGNLGDFGAIFEVSDGKLAKQVAAKGTVGTAAEVLALVKVALTRLEAGAKPKVDVLWVVDNTTNTAGPINSLLRSTKDFYSVLDEMGADHHTGVLSTRDKEGKLQKDDSGRSMLREKESGFIDSLRLQIRNAKGNSPNSPLVSLTKFHERVVEDLSLKDFFEEGSAVQVFVLTNEGDHFKSILGEKLTAKEYSKNLWNFHAERGRSLSVHVYDLRCPAVYTGTSNSFPYIDLSRETLGTYFYLTPSCDERVTGTISSLAAFSRLQATLMTHREVQLATAVPPSRLVVRQGGTEITVPQTQWSFDGKSKKLLIKWELLNARVQEGAELLISY